MTERRLAAILVADVVGYSRLIGADESGTLARLHSLRQDVIAPSIAKHSGRLFKTVGDGFLVEFASAVQAVTCAMAIQKANSTGSLPLRIGVHVGDVMVQGDDLMGDGVNIAARIEGLAEPGGVTISRAVHEQVRDRIDVGFEDKGEIELKNIARPVHVYAVVGAKAAVSPNEATPAPALPDKPSIAVLPFLNMSGDPEQEYFTDGITEDIITELSRFRSLFVIARNSSFTYKGKSPDIRQVARQLGVRYVLEGSIRKSANRIRVTGQLIDAPTGTHIWAERYDRVLEDIFAVQEEVTQAIVRAIAPYISEAEVAKVRRRRPDSLSAYEIAVRAYARAWDAWVKSDGTLCNEAIGEARAALAIDPDSTIALNALTLSQTQHLMRATALDRDEAFRDGITAARRSIEVDRADGTGHTLNGVLLTLAPEQHSIGEALDSARRGHDLNPHNMVSLMGLAYVETVAGNPESAIEHLLHALRVSPREPMRPNLHQQLAMACFSAQQYANSVTYAQLGIDEAPGLPSLHVYLAMSYVALGEIERAKAALGAARRVGPEFVERVLTGTFPHRNPEHLRRMTTFLHIAAGLEDPSTAEALR
ncbi:MAG: adenylate/guanylate cyclase domain-containing protein [Reyranella sp.]|nr:adenylate/guanylate cyclase domain-containing protein [Reyranella sp.]